MVASSEGNWWPRGQKWESNFFIVYCLVTLGCFLPCACDTCSKLIFLGYVVLARIGKEEQK